MQQGMFSTLRPMSIGYEDLFRYAETLLEDSNTSKFPPYNILKLGEEITVELALAGYAKEDISITSHNGLLTIASEKQPTDEKCTVVHRGISSKRFTKTFTLAENIVVKSADFVNGLLTIKLEHILPEEKKLRTIDIS